MQSLKTKTIWIINATLIFLLIGVASAAVWWLSSYKFEPKRAFLLAEITIQEQYQDNLLNSIREIARQYEFSVHEGRPAPEVIMLELEGEELMILVWNNVITPQTYTAAFYGEYSNKDVQDMASEMFRILNFSVDTIPGARIEIGHDERM